MPVSSLGLLGLFCFHDIALFCSLLKRCCDDRRQSVPGLPMMPFEQLLVRQQLPEDIFKPAPLLLI